MSLVLHSSLINWNKSVCRSPVTEYRAQYSSPIRATCPAHLILLDFTTRTKLGKEYRSLSSSLCNFLHSPATLSLLGPNTVLSTLFSDTLSLRSFLSVSDQVSHPYRTTGNIIVLYILMFTFWTTKAAVYLVQNQDPIYYSIAYI